MLSLNVLKDNSCTSVQSPVIYEGKEGGCETDDTFFFQAMFVDTFLLNGKERDFCVCRLLKKNKAICENASP